LASILLKEMRYLVYIRYLWSIQPPGEPDYVLFKVYSININMQTYHT
jgi:hypothetical protein